MKKIAWLTIMAMVVLGASAFLAGSGRQGQDPEMLLRAAIEKEEVDGDLQAAIALYKDIVAKFSERGAVAAKAQLRIGICYEKMGNEEATKAYEAVLNRFPREAETVAEARSRLAALKKELPKSLSVEKLEPFDTPGMSIQPLEVFDEGKKMVGLEVIKGQNIVICDLENKQVSFITKNNWDLKKDYSWAYHSVLSPDAGEIAYYECHELDPGPSENSLCVATLDGRSRVLASSTTEWLAPMSWLPDGSAILAYKGGNSAEEPRELGLISKTGGAFKKVVTLQGKGKNIALGRAYPIASVSPDGRYVLYTDSDPDGETDVYIVDIGGGSSRPLIKHPAQEKFPRWSPDGKSAVFLSTRSGNWALWGVAMRNGQAVGEPFLIQDGMNDAYLLNWTDGGLAAWSWIRINDVYLLDLDPATGEPAGEPRLLDYTPTGGNSVPIWSPDGKSVAFMKRVGASGLSVVVSSGGNAREFAIPAVDYASMTGVKWSPRGEAGIMCTFKDDPMKRELLCLDLDSGKWENRLLPPGPYTQFDWSGRDDAIYLAQAGPGESGGGVFELDLKTGSKRYIYQPSKETGAVMMLWMRSSRDFKRLAFIENNTYLVEVDLGSGESRRAATKAGFFSWSPDGRSFLVDGTFNPDRSKQSLFLIGSADGSVREISLARALPRESEIRMPDWCPDGKKVVFTLNANGGGVYLYRNVIPTKK